MESSASMQFPTVLIILRSKPHVLVLNRSEDFFFCQFLVRRRVRGTWTPLTFLDEDYIISTTHRSTMTYFSKNLSKIHFAQFKITIIDQHLHLLILQERALKPVFFNLSHYKTFSFEICSFHHICESENASLSLHSPWILYHL